MESSIKSDASISTQSLCLHILVKNTDIPALLPRWHWLQSRILASKVTLWDWVQNASIKLENPCYQKASDITKMYSKKSHCSGKRIKEHTNLFNWADIILTWMPIWVNQIQEFQTVISLVQFSFDLKRISTITFHLACHMNY